MPINVFRQSRCLNTSDSICDLFKWVCDRNDKGNGKSYVRANGRGLWIMYNWMDQVLNQPTVLGNHLRMSLLRHGTKKSRASPGQHFIKPHNFSSILFYSYLLLLCSSKQHLLHIISFASSSFSLHQDENVVMLRQFMGTHAQA